MNRIYMLTNGLLTKYTHNISGDENNFNIDDNNYDRNINVNDTIMIVKS
jgi:hypothetical protein